MIKGVSKQIVEINHTQNEYIEKAILIVNPEKAHLSKAEIDEEAKKYFETLLPAIKKQQKSNKVFVFAIISAAASIICLLVALILT